MRYVIETTETGCVETLEFSDGSKFTKRSERTASGGCKLIDEPFAMQLKKDGICEEIIDIVTDTFDGFGNLHFLQLAELDN